MQNNKKINWHKTWTSRGQRKIVISPMGQGGYKAGTKEHSEHQLGRGWAKAGTRENNKKINGDKPGTRWTRWGQGGDKVGTKENNKKINGGKAGTRWGQIGDKGK